MRKIVKVLAVVLVFVICLSFCGCVSKSDVVGKWERVKDDDYSPYLYFYKNGTYDYSGTGQSSGGTWELKNGEIVTEYSYIGNVMIISYIISGDKLTDQQGNVLYTKISDDTSVDVE